MAENDTYTGSVGGASAATQNMGHKGSVPEASTKKDPNVYKVGAYNVWAYFGNPRGVRFTILFCNKDSLPTPSGRYWTNQTAGQINTITRLLDKAFAAGICVEYSYDLEQLGFNGYTEKAFLPVPVP